MTIKKHVLSPFASIQDGLHDVTIHLPEIIGWQFGDYLIADNIALPESGNPIENGDKLRIVEDVPHDGDSMQLLTTGDVVEFYDVQEIQHMAYTEYVCIVYKDGEFFKVDPKFFAIESPYTKQSLTDRIKDILKPYRDAKAIKEQMFNNLVGI